MAARLTTYPDGAAGRVLIVYEGVTGPASMTRTVDGVALPVRSGQALDDGGLVIDYEAPLGVAVTYTLDGATSTTTVPTDGAGAWLVHPTDPSLSMRVTVVTDDANEWEAPGQVLEPIGSRDPIVVYRPRSRHRGSLIFRTSWEQRQDVIALFADGGPILVNPPQACPLEWEWMWGALRGQRKGNDAKGGIEWTLEYQRMAPPVGSITTPDTNTWLAAREDPDHLTWTAAGAYHATWESLLVTNHPHGSV